MKPASLAAPMKLTVWTLACAVGLGCQDSTPTSLVPESDLLAANSRRGDRAIAGYELVRLNLGGLEGYARAINNQDAVAGGVYRNGLFEAFVWKDGAVKFLGTLGGNFSFANGINDAGTVTGTSTNAAGEYHAFIWSPQRGMEDIGAGEGRGINGAEVVVGVSGSSAFRWTVADGMVTLRPIPDGYTSEAADVNNAGVVVGSATDAAGRHAVLWTDAWSAPRDLGTLGGYFSQPSAIADNGVIVGTSSTAFYTAPFRWTPSTGMKPLAEPGIAGQAFDVSTAGAVGNAFRFDPPVPAPTQCFWPPNGGCRPVSKSDATVIAINDRGVIAGVIPTAGPYGFAAVVWRPVTGHR